jgi:hypothetical protein
VTLIWLLIWLIANNVGGTEGLEFDPLNAWAFTLILAFALDVNRPADMYRSGKGE